MPTSTGRVDPDAAIAERFTVQPDERSKGQRFRDWLDFNHALGAVLLGGAAISAAPLVIFGVAPLIYPIFAGLIGLQLTAGKTWIKVDSPRLERTQADRVIRLTRELCDTIGCKPPRLHLALTAVPNAAATSMGGRGRMVVHAGLLEKLPDNEVKAVLAHEMGHIRQRHLAIIRALTWPLMFLRIDRIVGGALAFLHLGNAPGLLMTVGAWTGFLGTINGVMRLAERSADHYAGRVTGRPTDLADALRRLDPRHGLPTRSLLDVLRAGDVSIGRKVAFVPRYLLVKALGLVLLNHPPMATRIAYLERDQRRIDRGTVRPIGARAPAARITSIAATDDRSVAATDDRSIAAPVASERAAGEHTAEAAPLATHPLRNLLRRLGVSGRSVPDATTATHAHHGPTVPGPAQTHSVAPRTQAVAPERSL